MAENPPFWNQNKAFERKVSSKESFNMLGYDKIDKLDSSNSYLGDFGKIVQLSSLLTKL